ncbi:ephrin type-A receptor 2a isoform X3 [Myxocyprinus asiaticus]|uniref:ephrin type-A receptor 2a isoform X1 n=1 Tax=Myxocyprinus asiaticus TaxID=70543 RepID=UPI002222ACC6|nr:ephrin type-A receptor 2a isoform X1 [Myxocyprinus asiaticus]XP_051561851.1 ephrin type-A receptor 2a isoform X2 [Myxocyprinus asiaticus]XP_051561852.1 ephrin type-A receptor 2a isoform X3 [Myxocyprinus asiaticus]
MEYHRTSLRFLYLYLFVNSVFIVIQCKEHVLLDMKAAGSELGWLTWPNEEGWEIVQTVVNGSLLYTYSVCNVASDTEQDNWLRTTFIQRRPDVSRISVELRFVVRDCNTFGGYSPSCRETFGLYLAETDTDVGTNFRKSQFRKVATVAPDEVTADHGGGRADLRVNIETRSIGPLSRRGFYLAFQDLGGCVALLGLRVFYTTCPATMRSLAAFPEQVASGALVEVEGTCVKDAVVVGEAAPRMYCTAEGEWVVPVGQCLCRAGYQAVGETCKACEPGYYKSTDFSQPCEVCPDNTQRSGRGALLCPCLEGFFRAPTDPSSASCSALPSPPRDIVYTSLLRAGSLQLTWHPPADTGGRNDITYNVACERCEGGLCSPCGGRVLFEPAQTVLKDPEVVVSELEPHVNYTFTVEAQSGVSQFSRKKATTSITTVHHFTDGPRVLYLRVEDRTTSSLTLSWVVDHHLQNVLSPRYELMYRKKEDPGELDVTTYTVLVLEKNSVQINDLLPGTKYVFRVHTLTAEGHPSSHSAELEFETLALAESQTQNSSMVVMGAIAGGGVMLLLVVVILLVHKRRLNSHVRHRVDGDYFSCPEKLLPLKTYIDPHTYEDPCAAILKFASEIHPSHITKQKVIGAGEFGEVYRGSLKVPGRCEVAVAIKTLKPGYTEKQRQDFLSEASIMGQFSHKNIIRLEGVITKFKHAMIITEYMENGALDQYLRDHDGDFSSYQLVGMLSGIAAGMKYLSDMNYVHRDLAARNVLVNGNLECKVSDFGLSRVLEDFPEGTYTTTGGKIPIRWTAPEAIAYRKFTSASDVWSFGIVMWEVMSFGERPYWDMSNHEVMKSINEGFRLPAPMGCPSAVNQLILQCWMQDRSKRPRFVDIVNLLEKLLQNPESLSAIASVDPRVSIRLPSTSGNDSAPFRSVDEWLESIKMAQYRETFAHAGIKTMEQVLRLKFEDIRNIGVRLPGHQKRISYSILGLQDPTGTLDIFAV